MIIPFLLVCLTHSSTTQEWSSVRDSSLELSDTFYPLQSFDFRNKRVQRFTNKNDNPKSEFEIVTQINARPRPHRIPLNSEASKEEEFHDKLNFDLNFDNDGFIRHKRDANANAKPSPKDQTELTDLNRNPVNTGTGEEQKSRMLLQEEGSAPDGSREPRGATKEQWIKQPYPVHSATVSENTYEDPISSSSTEVRAPRVHFVTQKRTEAAPSLVYKNFEREGRNRDFPREEAKEPQRATPRSSPRIPAIRKPERDYYPERPLKQYDPYYRSFYPHQDEPYYRYEESRYDPQYATDNYERYRPEATSHRQRRIIYYATLPEVVRTPPNVNLRDRFNYRDRYDDRYLNSPLSITENNEYRLEKPYSFLKSRYDHEMERAKAPYPLKVSTDLNVRETKKNPERRIYSEPDRRYAYKSLPYQPEGIFDRRI